MKDQRMEDGYGDKKRTEEGGERGRRTKTPEQALSALMRLAARGERSSGDALRLMRSWGVDPARQQQVLGKLIDQRFIDDRRYAAAYVREKSRLNGWGEWKIRRMLSSKGIDKAIIDDALGGIDPACATEKLESLLVRKARGAKEGDRYALKGKLMRYGMSLGYDYDQVIGAVERVTASIYPLTGE